MGMPPSHLMPDPPTARPHCLTNLAEHLHKKSYRSIDYFVFNGLERKIVVTVQRMERFHEYDDDG